MRVLEGKAAIEAAKNLTVRGSVTDPKVERTVRRIVTDVREKGMPALRKYAKTLDGLKEDESLRVPEEELRDALSSASPDFIKAAQKAAVNIRRFAEWQMPKSWMRTMQPGIRVGQKVVPIWSVGCYVPGGRHPLPSSLLMTVLPAQVAGVPYIWIASPNPSRETLATAYLIGARKFYRMGGAQAIAAFAYGVEPSKTDARILPVNKVVGPGNAYVTAAKKLVSFDCAIDMLAGPTEAVVVAHEGNASFHAADLVAQAEHDPRALVVFISSSRRLAQDVARECERMAKENPVARDSLKRNAVALIIPNRLQAIGIANALAPEHMTVPAGEKLPIEAGSVFVGQYSPQSLGDYASGPNHTLPTGGAARYRGGLSVLDFVKIITVQQVTKAGLKKIAPVVTTLAEAEGLKAHAESVRVRLR